jgi:hypothetical protein
MFRRPDHALLWMLNAGGADMKLVVIVFALSALAAPAAHSQVSGTWTFAFERDMTSRDLLEAPASADCRVTQDGGRLTGSCGSNEQRLTGVVNGRKVTVRVHSAILTGEITADGITMKGTWRERARFGKFTATKQ